jgi:ribonuclease HI
MKESKIDIYSDGSCIGNPGPGGWAAIILAEGKTFDVSGNEEDTTNNRMEMKAIVEALNWVRTKSGVKEDDLNSLKINIFSDSNLIIQTINQGWKRKANTDLWAEMDIKRAWLNITWNWVKGHADNKYNNMADELAQQEARKLT